MATVAAPLEELTLASNQESSLAAGEQHFRLNGLNWAAYRKISDALTGHHVRLSYYRGTLELMSKSFIHSRLSRLLGLLISVLSEETGLPQCSCGDMTCDREDRESGVEPDECFYLQNEPLIREKEQIEFPQDPPPDLVVEVDITRSSKIRMPAYAAIGVPEFWRYAKEQVEIYHRNADGQFVLAERSLSFPFLTGADLARFLNLRTEMDENALVRSFRAWVREQIAKKV